MMRLKNWYLAIVVVLVGASVCWAGDPIDGDGLVGDPGDGVMIHVSGVEDVEGVSTDVAGLLGDPIDGHDRNIGDAGDGNEVFELLILLFLMLSP